MATRLIGTDTANPRLPAVVITATQGTTSADLAPGDVGTGTLVLAKAYTDQEIAEVVAGGVQFADNTETIVGTNDAKAVTPAGLAYERSYLDVRSYGATGDGSTDDTAAINAALTAGAGHTVFVPKGTFMIDAVTGLKMTGAGTRLLLDAGATLKVIPNAATGYTVVEVLAADCVIEGGTFLGDVGTHTGSTGEWGHLITTGIGGDRLRIVRTRVTKAWGDGIALEDNAADVSIIDVVAEDNRRNGISIIQAVRPRVYGGVWRNQGLTANTAPSSGICVEPNASGAVVDCVIVGATVTGNRGSGFQIASATGSTNEVMVVGCRSNGSTTAHGFLITGPVDTIKCRLIGCQANANTVTGFFALTNRVEFTSCTAQANVQYGWQVQGSDCILTAPVATENGRHGIQISAATVLNTTITGGLTRANSQTTHASYVNIDQWGVGTRITGHVSEAGTLTNKPAWGYNIRASSTGRIVGCDARSGFASGNYNDASGAGNTPAFPVPGIAKQTFNAAATDPATTMALANNLRTSLINLGFGA